MRTVVDLSRYRGMNQFGRAYQVMLENDAHAPGSVDRVLVERMARLCPETAAHLYGEYTLTKVEYQKGSRPALERHAAESTAGCGSAEEQIDGIARFCANLGQDAPQDLDAMRVGGTEEEIIRRGSDWCTDVARVGCVLCQIAGFPARLVNLFDTALAYSGHVIIEAYRAGVWGAVDPTTNVVYRHPNGQPATTWELMNQPRLIESHWRAGLTPYTTVGQFRSAAISNYFVWDWKAYDYTVSPLNDYYRSILTMSMQGWPGGLRWIHGEDHELPKDPAVLVRRPSQNRRTGLPERPSASSFGEMFMHRVLSALIVAVAVLPSTVTLAQEASRPMNLLLNPSFEFHCFEPHRLGRPESFRSRNVAFWNAEAWGDITVTREAHVEAKFRPSFSTHNMVSIAPGKKLWQFVTLPEVGLAHGERVSLFVYGHQPAASALCARIKLVKLDSEDGTWSPGDLGMGDKRTFPKHSRGELVVAKSYEARAEQVGPVELKIENAEIVGRFHDDKDSHSDDINTIALQVEFENTGSQGDVWVYSPCLCAGPKALPRLPQAREMTPYYRYIPRTIQKLWKGEPIHIIAMGSSIDRGSANPPMYLYDEDPNSPTFKKPLSERLFDAAKVNRPDLEGYIGWWQHFFCYTGRLRLELMRKFNVPVSNICMNIMACDGSCVGEAHSGLKDYCSLSLPPEENTNGHKSGRTWQVLYPGLFARPEGPRPDLVIFGMGANEKTDTPDEVAVFEGMIRWIQRHYPNTEFLFCMFQNVGGYTPNAGDLKALAQRYQIPVLDYGKVGDDLTRWCNRYAFVPSDGHPQAASHFVWFKQLEKAFECWDPVLPGQAQLQLPERVHPNSYGWEGEVVTFDESSGRLKGGKFIFEDTAINCWGVSEDEKVELCVDGQKQPSRGGKWLKRDVRNSLFRHGRCPLGDRHVLEFVGKGAKLTFVDAKVCPDRRFIGVDSPLWTLGGAKVADFPSAWGAPYGSEQAMLQPGAAFELDAVCTDVSVAYVDTAQGGTLRVLVDGVEKLSQPTNASFVDAEKAEHFMENRKGILGLGFGLHTIRLEAADAPVAVLGLFTYDSRGNRQFERRLAGRAAAGETVPFSLPFAARPLVICHGDLAVKTADITPTKVTFSGKGTGSYEIIGE